MVSQAQAICRILDTKDYSFIAQNNLTEEYFSDYKAEFNYIKNNYDTYKAVPDKITFLSVFPNFDYMEVTEPNSYILEQLITDYKTNYMVSVFNNVKRQLESGQSVNAEEAIKRAAEQLNKVRSTLSCVDLIQDKTRYQQYLEKASEGAKKKYYISTGFPELDAKIGGIDMLEENMVIIARTGQGKTQILLKMAAEASKQGKTVGIYEGEMTAEKVGYRIDTFLSNITNSYINRGDAIVNAEYKAYIDSLSDQGYGPIKVFTPNDVPGGIVTVDTLKAFIERENIDILFVDQYDLLDDKTKGYTRAEFERVGNIAKNIKQLQVEERKPIISVCQMNRTKNEDGEQDTTQVAGSDKISRYATTIIALEQKKPDEKARTIELTLNVIKARDGGDHNKLKYTTNFNEGTFHFIPIEEDGVTTEAQYQEMADRYTQPVAEGTVFN